MSGVYIIGQWGPVLQSRIPADFWINGTWDSVYVFYVGF